MKADLIGNGKIRSRLFGMDRESGCRGMAHGKIMKPKKPTAPEPVRLTNANGQHW